MKRLISMVALCVAFLFSSASYAVSCSGAPTYSAGTNYTQNQSVQNKGSLYRCDIPGWCSSTAAWAYEPGVGSAWTLAWTSLGACTGTTSSAPSSSRSSVASVSSSRASSIQSSVSTATYGVEAGAASATFFVNGSTSFADLHYTKNSGAQQNLSMPLVNGRRAYTVTGLVNGDVIRYWFTYQPTGSGAIDTSAQTYTHGSTTTSSVSSSVTSSRSSSSSSRASSSVASSIAGGWRLVWSDEFNGTGQPDAAKWNYHVGNGYNSGIAAFDGWGNQELEWYRPENCYQQGGNLVIRGANTPITTNGKTYDWRSCRITTQGKASWTYGRIEASISSPSVQGKWGAFWMLGDSSSGSYTTDYNAPISRYDTMAGNWPSIGEVDIFENVNQDTFSFHHNFWDTRIGVFPYAAGSVADYGGQGQIGNIESFHLYVLEWDQNQQRYYIDGVQTVVVDITPASLEEFRKPMHLILNMALGGRLVFGYNPIPAQWPRDMLVDYVRVYQK